jgi:hypothetical protein
MKEILDSIIERIDEDIRDFEIDRRSDLAAGFDQDAVEVGKIIIGLHLARKCVTEERVKLKNK